VGGCGCHDGRKATSPASSSSPTACRRFTTPRPLQPPPAIACITSSPQPQLQVGGRGTGKTLKVGWETCAVKEGIVGPTKQATISIRSDTVCVSRCFTMQCCVRVTLLHPQIRRCTNSKLCRKGFHYMSSRKAANWVSFDFNVAYSSR